MTTALPHALPPADRALLDDQERILAATWRQLADKPEESIDATLRALWLTAGGTPCSARRAESCALAPLDDDAAARFRSLVRRRAAGEPLAHLTGRQSFLGLEMLSDARALIPRAETELLATTALAAARARIAEQGGATVVDVCTGSGNVALAIAAHAPEARVFAADLSDEAVALARRNAERLGLASRVTFAVGDLFAPLRDLGVDEADVITCNPPYISSGKLPLMDAEIARFEPALAFDGGTLGFDLILRVLADAPALLRRGGLLCMEVGAGQGAFIARRVARLASSYRDVGTVADAAGEARVVTAIRAWNDEAMG